MSFYQSHKKSQYTNKSYRISSPVSVSWKWMDEQRANAEIEPFARLFIVEGLQIFDFIQATVLKQLSPICQTTGYKMSIYQLPQTGDYVCVCEDNDLDQSAEVTALLLPWLTKAKKTYIFPFHSAYAYNTERDFDKRCFIRTISNAGVDGDLGAIMEPMEDCNFVSTLR